MSEIFVDQNCTVCSAYGKFINKKNKNISNVTNLKILPIGSKQYLALVKLDYKDSLDDVDIVETNTALKIEIVETESTITEIYFNPQ